MSVRLVPSTLNPAKSEPKLKELPARFGASAASVWLDPNYSETFNIFENLITAVNRGSTSTQEAIQEADARLNDLLR
jgi:hypothetical protein